MLHYLFKHRYSYADLIGIGGLVAILTEHAWWWFIPWTAWLLIVSYVGDQYNDDP